MKTVISLIVISVLFISLFMHNLVMAEATIADYPVLIILVDDKPVTFGEQLPILVNDRTLVPVQDLFRIIDYCVIWKHDFWNNYIALANGENVIVLTVAGLTFTVNDKIYSLDIPAQYIGTDIFIPLRPILESVGYIVSWDKDSRSVLISTPLSEEIDSVSIKNIGNKNCSELDEYTVTFIMNLDGATGILPSPVVSQRGEVIRLPDSYSIRHEDGFFDGWRIEGVNARLVAGSQAVFTKDVYLVTGWVFLWGGEYFD